MKMIQDTELQEMLDRKVPQNEIARHFSVSPSAVCQRIKRLKHEVLPESLEKLSAKERQFVMSKIQGKSNTSAALDAFNCSSVESAHTLGVRLSNDPDVKIAISDLMHQEGIGRRHRVKRLRDIVNAGDLGIAARGLDLSWKLDGSYAPEKIDIQVTYDAQAARDRLSELRLMLAEAQDSKNIIEI